MKEAAYDLASDVLRVDSRRFVFDEGTELLDVLVALAHVVPLDLLVLLDVLDSRRDLLALVILHATATEVSVEKKGEKRRWRKDVRA
jgi:hypothetical protein